MKEAELRINYMASNVCCDDFILAKFYFSALYRLITSGCNRLMWKPSAYCEYFQLPYAVDLSIEVFHPTFRHRFLSETQAASLFKNVTFSMK